MTAFGSAIRSQWHLDPEVDFLNNGSFGATPKPVLEVQSALRLALERQPVAFMESLPERWEAACAAVAPAYRCDPADVVFVDNATSAVNAVVRSLPLGPGDAILTTNHAYGAVRKCLIYACERSGATLIEAPVAFPIDGPEAVVSALRDALDAPQIRLVVLDHITSKTGLILPIEAMVAVCRERGVPVLVDGAHVPGHLPLDIPAIGAEWYTGNLHKWSFAPKGCAILWAHPKVQEQTRPPVISHGHGAGFQEEFSWQGTKDPTPWLCAAAAIDFLDDLGAEAVWSYNRSLADQAADRLAEAWGTDRPAPRSMCGAMVTLDLPVRVPATEEAALDLHRALLARHGVEVPCFPFGDRTWTRISAQVFNTLDDYDRLAAAFTRDGLR